MPRPTCLQRGCLTASRQPLPHPSSSLAAQSQAELIRADLAAASAAGSTIILPLLLRLAARPPPPESGYPHHEPPPRLLMLTLRAGTLLCFRAPSTIAAAVRASGVLGALVPHCMVGGKFGRRLSSLLLALACNVDALAPMSAAGCALRKHTPPCPCVWPCRCACLRQGTVVGRACAKAA